MLLESQCQDESFKGLDIFISSCWPRGVSQFAKQPVSLIIIHQTHYEKSDWSRAFNQFTIACELDMIHLSFQVQCLPGY